MAKNKRELKSYRRKRLREIILILSRHELTKGITPEKLTAVIADLGPTYIKLGQIMAMRRDLLPKEYCDKLLELQTHINPLPFEEILEVLEEEYGEDPYDIFEVIEEKPLGSASIAQVHRAVLKEDESDVVIKIQRPGIYETMQQDVQILLRASKILNLIGPKGPIGVIDLEAVINEMWHSAKQEMDFMIEASNAERFAKLNKDIVYFDSPKIYRKHTTTKVLVMNYIDGLDLESKEALEARGYDLDEISRKLCTNYIKQVITDGFFHADPHQGNIRIHDGKIAWIDLGMMGTLSEHDKKLFYQMISAVALNNTDSLKSAFLQLGEHTGKVDESRLYEQIDSMLSEYRTLDINDINVEKFLDEIMQICIENHISMPSDITMLYRGIITIESVITNLSPSSNVLSIMTDYIVSEREFPDLKKSFSEFARNSLAAGKASLHLPVSAEELVNMMLKGQIKFNMALTGSQEPLSALAKMINRLVMGIITAALLIGSSFIATTGMNPKILGIPALGFIGYIGSLGLGFWIVIQMLLQDRSLDKHK